MAKQTPRQRAALSSWQRRDPVRRAAAARRYRAKPGVAAERAKKQRWRYHLKRGRCPECREELFDYGPDALFCAPCKRMWQLGSPPECVQLPDAEPQTGEEAALGPVGPCERAWREQAEPWGKIEYAAVPVFGVAAAADWRLKVELIPVEHWQPRDDRAQAILRGRFNAVARWIGRRLDVERVHERCRQDGWRPAALAA